MFRPDSKADVWPVASGSQRGAAYATAIRRRGASERCLYWRLFRPVKVGARALLVRHEQVLLVRHAYDAPWYLPGGGVRRGETLEQAVRRELAEEVGARLGEVRFLAAYTNLREGKSDHVAVLACHDFALGTPDGVEVGECVFFPLAAPPDVASPGTRRRILDYLAGDAAGCGDW